MHNCLQQILDAKKHALEGINQGKDPDADTSLPVRCTHTGALERKIDEMVYALYSLTDDEIAIVPGKKLI